MNAQQHFDATSEQFLKLFGLTLQDAGFDPERFFHAYGDLAPRDAALEAGDDYDLQRVDLGWR
ncbi:hypothetical protein LN96_10245 [Xanthomonas citri pv. citri]|uniref:hypothetical protein n=1 Tax=Xanthomonas citri TaxID=346 RepID=UPI00052D7F65|nr:hypothetical protein [Xanthomonas citri]OMG05153.1 hypothetical protein LN96_10245 [Xanthomonas citri pv. citri]PIB21019.1 hypothetical protein AA099_07530 [Xanthomonas citri pv. citri]CEE84473.1 conserved hypothetical protein [Xanthomonas citri pv. citri]CEH59897.1 conserved hypothetical protein [Xanthomonas citri pv. citri]